MIKYLSINYETGGRCSVSHRNGKIFAELIMGDDGFWIVWFDKNSTGGYPSYILRELSDKLDEMNASYAAYLSASES